jgi:hypothetical protein
MAQFYTENSKNVCCIHLEQPKRYGDTILHDSMLMPKTKNAEHLKFIIQHASFRIIVSDSKSFGWLSMHLKFNSTWRYAFIAHIYLYRKLQPLEPALRIHARKHITSLDIHFMLSKTIRGRVLEEKKACQPMFSYIFKMNK